MSNKSKKNTPGAFGGSNILSISSFWRNDVWKMQIGTDKLMKCLKGGAKTFRKLLLQAEAGLDRDFAQHGQEMVDDLIRQTDKYHASLQTGQAWAFEGVDDVSMALLMMFNIHWLCTHGHHPTDNFNGLMFLTIQ